MRAHLLLLSCMGTLIASSGCINKRELAGDQKLEDVLCEKNHYFLDEDGDNWGDPAVAPEWACEEDREQGGVFTARNNRDCDDSDNSVTGRLGVCPSAVADGGGYTQVAVDESEYLIVPRQEIVSSDQAQSLCENWAGLDEEQPLSTLATFENEGEATAILTALASQAPGPAFFLSLEWTGNDWEWPGDGVNLGTDILPWCGERPEGLDGQHLALVYSDLDDEWCLDASQDAFFGSFICERFKPDFNEFAYFANVVDASENGDDEEAE